MRSVRMASTRVSVSGPRRSATSNSRETFSRAAAVPPAITMPAMRRAAVTSTASRDTNAQSPSPSSIGIASLTTPYPAGCSRYSRVKNCQIACVVDSEPPRSTITGRWASADPATITANASSAQSRERQLAERSHRTWTAVQGTSSSRTSVSRSQPPNDSPRTAPARPMIGPSAANTSSASSGRNNDSAAKVASIAL